VNDKSEMMWKEAVVAYFKVISRHLPRGTEENHEKSQPCSYRQSQAFGLDLIHLAPRQPSNLSTPEADLLHVWAEENSKHEEQTGDHPHISYALIFNNV
jgi:hypothetical protein